MRSAEAKPEVSSPSAEPSRLRFFEWGKLEKLVAFKNCRIFFLGSLGFLIPLAFLFSGHPFLIGFAVEATKTAFC